MSVWATLAAPSATPTVLAQMWRPLALASHVLAMMATPGTAPPIGKAHV